MLTVEEIKRRLGSAFSPEQASALAEVLAQYQQELATARNLRDLREAIQQLAEAQRRTEERLEQLAEAQRRTEERLEQLAEAQRRTEERLNRLEATVQQLAEAQRRTEERLNRLEATVQQLAEAQRRTEERLQQLAEAQRRTEERLNRLEATVQQLAEAQRRTEERLQQLAEAQRRTEERLNRLEATVQQLAEAQRRTEDELRRLTAEHRETRRQLGGLAITVGYRLEDEAFKALPRLLQEDFGLQVEGRLRRAYLRDREDRAIEVNIVGTAVRDGERFTIIGESKAQLSKNDVDGFLRRKLKRLEGVVERPLPILVTYMTTGPEVEEYARSRGVKVYYSYQF